MTDSSSHLALKNAKVGTSEYFSIQKKIILSRPLIKHCYDIWYSKLLNDENSVPTNNKGSLLELGSGGSYLKDLKPGVITSDVVDNVADMTVDGRKLPFDSNSLRCLFLTHTIHHIPDVERFFSEAQRTLVKDGVISLIEVTNTVFAKVIFNFFHPEPFLPNAKDWNFKQNDSMLDANQALSWIVFVRDKEVFNEKFPGLIIEKIEYLPWFSYLFSGGVTKKNRVPKFIVPLFKLADLVLSPLNPIFALHWHIRIRKQ